MRKLHRLFLLSLVIVLGPCADDGLADDIDSETTWERIRREGKSIVFGRLEGRFDGTEYRGRRLRVRHTQTGEEYDIAVGPGLGYFEAALPTGTYELVAIEATYFPRVRPLNPQKFPPVGQRYAIRPIPDVGLPSFPVVTEMPVYLGTLVSRAGDAGLVYDGHELQILDEFEQAWSGLSLRYPSLAASLRERDVEPRRFFFLEPASGPMSLERDLDPLERARSYLSEGRFEQALRWLETLLPTSDSEREAMRLLVGEALLGQKRYAEAIEEVGEVLLADPENVRALRLLARAHALNGNRDDAMNLYRALTSFRPEDAEANLHLGYHHALRSEEERAENAFEAAFEDNFDYLLHDLTPYALALSVEEVRYEPASIQQGFVRIPRTMRSRRSTRGGFALLVDHDGRVLAAHLTPEAEQWAATTLMALVRARFKPARLNGVPIPCLIILGEADLSESAR